MIKKVPSILMMITLGAAIFITSCSKKTELTTQQKVVGKWNLDAAIGAYTVMGEVSRDTTLFSHGEYIQFNADGTLETQEDDDSTAGKWTITNEKLVVTETGSIDYPGGFTITELSGNKLELYYTQTQGETSLEQKIKLKK
ncbi:MAG: lipocalin family protein [Flavitalea sp.]